MQVQPRDVDYTLEPFVNLSPTQINCHVASQDLLNQPKNDDVILYKKYPESLLSLYLQLVEPNA